MIKPTTATLAPPPRLPASEGLLRSVPTSELRSPLRMYLELVCRQRPLRSILLVLTAAGGISLMGFEPLLLKQLFDLLQGGSSLTPDLQKNALKLFGWIGLVWWCVAVSNRFYRLRYPSVLTRSINPRRCQFNDFVSCDISCECEWFMRAAIEFFRTNRQLN